MSKKDYTKFSKSHTVDHGGTNDSSIPEVTYSFPEDDMAEEEVAISEPEKKPLVFGKVIGCQKLNVRQYPNLHADILCCLAENTEVEIDEDKSTTDFYSICTPAGREGFCLKKFVEICM